MGSSISRTDDLTKNEYLTKFVSDESLTPNDPFWNRFLAFNIHLPNTSIDQSALDLQLEPIGSQLLKNNTSTENVSSLVNVFLIRAAELLTATNTEDNLFTWQTFNTLFVLRCVIKYLAENVTEEEMIQYLERRSVLSNSVNKNDVVTVETLIGTLIGILVDVPLKDITYYVHLESVTCLLVLLSCSVVHCNKRPQESIVYRSMMRGKHAMHSPLIVKCLLRNFMEDRKGGPPPLDNNGHSLVLGIASELWSILTFGRSKKYDIDNNELTEYQQSPLSIQSLLLLLVLVNHCTRQEQHNPYRIVLFSCTDSKSSSSSTIDIDLQQQQNVASFNNKTSPMIFKIDYDQLLNTLCKRSNGECCTLLLYLLIHRNGTFRTYLLNSNRLDSLIVPVLKTLYNAPNSNSHHIYMSLIILLILSEDDSFNRNIHDTMLKNVTWYTERPLSEVSLGGLLVLVVIRTIQYNMLKMRDKYLHTNCLAALANMSGQFRNLHPYVSQRLISLFETLAKRYLKLRQQQQELNQTSNNDVNKTSNNDINQMSNDDITETSKVDVSNTTSNNDVTSMPKSDRLIDLTTINEDQSVVVTVETSTASIVAQDLSVLEEVIRMVLEILNSCLTNKLSSNPNLVYTLLYKRHVFESFRDEGAFKDIVRNVDVIINYFTTLLETEKNEVDARHVLEVIQTGTKSWPKEKLTKFADLKFKYVEEEQPEEFFVPYVWSLVSQKSIFHCNGTETTQLLNV